MREYLIILETMAPEREIEVLHSTNDSSEALEQLVALSDKREESIITGKCRVIMTTYVG